MGNSNVRSSSDVNFKNLDGYSPIFLAVRNGHTEAAKLLIQYGADVDFVFPIKQNSFYSGKSLVKSVPKSKPELKALLELTIACKKNNFEILSEITPKNVQDFLDWQLTITPENSKFFSKHLSGLYNLQSYLTANLKLTNIESMRKLGDTIKSYSTLKNSLIFKIVENPEIVENYKSDNKDFKYENLPEDIRYELEKAGLKLAGEVQHNPLSY